MNYRDRKKCTLFPSSSFFLLLLLLISIMSTGCFVFTKRYWDDPPEFPRYSELESMGDLDYDWIFYTLEGEEKTFRDFEDRALFVTIWATWCGACQSELPSVQRLYDSMKDTGVAFLFLSEQKASTVNELLETNGYTFPAYVYEGRLPDVLRTAAFPTTYIVHRSGSIIFSHIGAARWDTQACKHFLYHLIQ